MERPEIGKRTEGKPCAGKCRHSNIYHQAKMFNSQTGHYEYGCCYCDCSCMNYVAPEADSEQTDSEQAE